MYAHIGRLAILAPNAIWKRTISAAVCAHYYTRAARTALEAFGAWAARTALEAFAAWAARSLLPRGSA